MDNHPALSTLFQYINMIYIVYLFIIAFKSIHRLNLCYIICVCVYVYYYVCIYIYI